MNYELKLERFSGPIEKLLELIEEKKLEITEFSLAAVTAEFLDYLKKIEAVEPRLLADFIAVASQLLLIKSKNLLPDIKLNPEEEEKIKDLENRLLFYRQFKPAMNYLKQFSEQKNILISRPFFAGRQTFFYPSENVKIDALCKAIKAALETFLEAPPTETIRSSLITLEQKTEEIIGRIKKMSTGGFKFGELTAEKSRSEIIVLFLAILHLLANQLIRIEQKNRFDEMVIKKH